MTAVAERPLVAAALLGLAAAALGGFVAVAPTLAIALIGFGIVLVLAFVFPAMHLTVLLLVTGLVPFDALNSVGGGTGSIGLNVADVLILTGLARAAVVLPQRPLDRVGAFAVAAAVLFLIVLAVQFLHGVASGATPSDAGVELRALLGLSVVLIALPLVDDPGLVRRLLPGLVVTGVILGLVGVGQWVFGLPFAASADFGVREGVAGTTAGRGQVQGGLYAFPVAIILAFAALLSGAVRTWPLRWALIAILALNGAALVLTFERTFWLVTVLGCLFVGWRFGGGRRGRALIIAPLALMIALVPLALLAPGTLTTARERLLSLGQYGTDSSVRYRVTEARHVVGRIAEDPWAGSGLGARVVWGRPWEGVLPAARSYAHNGYLWLAWKLGVVIASLCTILLLAAVLRRGRGRGSPMLDAVVLGSQGALLALAVASITFPAFNSPVTPVMGLLLAFCAGSRTRDGAVPEA